MSRQQYARDPGTGRAGPRAVRAPAGGRARPDHRTAPAPGPDRPWALLVSGFVPKEESASGESGELIHGPEMAN